MQVSAHHAHAAYTQGQVSASNPLRIIVLLYEGAIRFTRQGLDQFDNTAARGQALGRAHAIVSELQLALDHDAGPEVAEGLDRLYRYLLDGLIRANVDGNASGLDSVIDVLETLASGWLEVEAKQRAGETP